MYAAISSGNTKLGQIPNLSLPPLQTCVDNPPCAKLCYARRIYERYGILAGRLWDRNLQFYREEPEMFFDSIREQLYNDKALRLFRWHVSGDIPDEQYFRGMIAIARHFPNVDFLAYTRRKYAMEPVVKNLNVVESVWLGDEPDGRYPWFKVLPKDEPVSCQGECQSCAECWYLKPGEGRTVNLH